MRVVVVLACIAVAIAGLKFASSVMAPIIFAGFLTLVSAPLVDTLHRKGLPRWLAISVTCLSVIVIGGAVFFTLYTSLSHFRDELPTYQAQMANRTSDIDLAHDHGIDTSDANALSAFNGESLGKIALKLIDFILESLSGFWFLFLLIVFFMIDSELLATRAQRQLSTVDRRWPAVRGFVRDLQKFFVIKLGRENLLISGSMVVMLIIFDVPYPFLWGIIGFFMSYIPAVG